MVPESRAATRGQATTGRPGTASAAKTGQRASVAPTLADLRVLWGGRDRLLKIAEVAEHLGLSNATVYGLCERGELPYVWVVTAMRVRPRDLEAFVASRLTVAERRRLYETREVRPVKLSALSPSPLLARLPL